MTALPYWPFTLTALHAVNVYANSLETPAERNYASRYITWRIVEFALAGPDDQLGCISAYPSRGRLSIKEAAHIAKLIDAVAEGKS